MTPTQPQQREERMLPKLTKAGRELLRVLAVGPRTDVTDERGMVALMRLGLADLQIDESHFDERTWQITDAGRAALAGATS